MNEAVWSSTKTINTTNSSCLLSSSKKEHDRIITRNTKIHVFTIWPSVWFDANSTSSHKYLLETRTNRWQKRRRGSLPCAFPSLHRAFPLTFPCINLLLGFLIILRLEKFISVSCVSRASRGRFLVFPVHVSLCFTQWIPYWFPGVP